MALLGYCDTRWTGPSGSLPQRQGEPGILYGDVQYLKSNEIKSLAITPHQFTVVASNGFDWQWREYACLAALIQVLHYASEAGCFGEGR